MATPYDYFDPATGMPRRQATGAAYPGVPQFNAAGATGATGGGTGYNATGAVGGATAPGAVDYAAILRSDPLFLQSQADLAAGSFADRAGLKAGRQKAIINFGEWRPDFGDLQGDIDPATQQLAQQNTAAGLSTRARLDKALKDNLRIVRSMLAARGALQSGELGHQLGEEDLRFRTAEYDSRRQLSEYLAGMASVFAQAEQQRAYQRSAAAAAAAGRGVAGGTGGPPPSAPPAAPPAGPGPADPNRQPAPFYPSATPQDEFVWSAPPGNPNRHKIYQPY